MKINIVRASLLFAFLLAGLSPALSAEAVSAPLITNVSPTSGPVETTITVTGNYFSSPTYLLIDGQNGGTGTNANSANTSVTFVIPASTRPICNLFGGTDKCSDSITTLAAGVHQLSVVTVNGTSTAGSFTITSGTANGTTDPNAVAYTDANGYQYNAAGKIVGTVPGSPAATLAGTANGTVGTYTDANGNVIDKATGRIISTVPGSPAQRQAQAAQQAQQAQQQSGGFGDIIGQLMKSLPQLLGGLLGGGNKTPATNSNANKSNAATNQKTGLSAADQAKIDAANKIISDKAATDKAATDAATQAKNDAAALQEELKNTPYGQTDSQKINTLINDSGQDGNGYSYKTEGNVITVTDPTGNTTFVTNNAQNKQALDAFISGTPSAPVTGSGNAQQSSGAKDLPAEMQPDGAVPWSGQNTTPSTGTGSDTNGATATKSPFDNATFQQPSPTPSSGDNSSYPGEGTTGTNNTGNTPTNSNTNTTEDVGFNKYDPKTGLITNEYGEVIGKGNGTMDSTGSFNYTPIDTANPASGTMKPLDYTGAFGSNDTNQSCPPCPSAAAVILAVSSNCDCPGSTSPATGDLTSGVTDNLIPPVDLNGSSVSVPSQDLSGLSTSGSGIPTEFLPSQDLLSNSFLSSYSPTVFPDLVANPTYSADNNVTGGISDLPGNAFSYSPDLTLATPASSDIYGGLGYDATGGLYGNALLNNSTFDISGLSQNSTDGMNSTGYDLTGALTDNTSPIYNDPTSWYSNNSTDAGSTFGTPSSFWNVDSSAISLDNSASFLTDTAANPNAFLDQFNSTYTDTNGTLGGLDTTGALGGNSLIDTGTGSTDSIFNYTVPTTGTTDIYGNTTDLYGNPTDYGNTTYTDPTLTDPTLTDPTLTDPYGGTGNNVTTPSCYTDDNGDYVCQ